MLIKILLDHDIKSEAVGKMYLDEYDHLIVHFKRYIPVEAFWSAFSGAGVEFLDTTITIQGNRLVKKAKIHEFSVITQEGVPMDVIYED